MHLNLRSEKEVNTANACRVQIYVNLLPLCGKGDSFVRKFKGNINYLSNY